MHATGRRLFSLLMGVGLALVFASTALATNPVPLINQPLVPDAVAPGGSTFTLTVNGTGFVSGAVVNWNGSSRTTTFVGAMQLTASILASDIAAPSTASVTVVNPTPGGGVSNVVFLPIIDPTSSVGFGLASSPSTGFQPLSVAVGDFNGDGKLDLAVANSGRNTLSILLGDGTGNFILASSPIVGTGPDSVAVGDFNGDGNLDLAVANGGSNTVSILLGDGTGNFTLTSSFAVGQGPISVAVGDFNGDGDMDLAVVNACGNIDCYLAPGTVSVLLGDGTGNFTVASSPATNIEPSSVAVGDFNGDGRLDLAVVNKCGSIPNCTQGGPVPGTVSILLGDGTGNFALASSPMTGDDPTSVAVGDFNGDGNLDLAVANGNSNTASILLGDGTGNFTLASSPSAGDSPTSVAVGDFNGDGNLDLAVANGNSNTASILLGDGTGNFTLTSSAATGNIFAVSVAVGDFNEDGRLDLAVANYCGLGLCGDDPGTISILVQGPVVTLTSTNLVFGSQYVGSASVPMSSMLTSAGSTTLDISGISITGTNAGDFSQTNTCGTTVAVGASCTISVTFTPAASGARTAILNIFDNASGSPQMIYLNGTGTDTAFSAPVLSPTSLIVTAGQSGSFTATVTPAVGVGAVTFTCAGAPATVSCTAGPSVMNTDGTVTSTINVTTTARSIVPPARTVPPLGSASLQILLWGLCALAGSLGAFLLSIRLRPSWSFSQRTSCVALVLLMMSVGLLAGCGSSGGSRGGGGQNGTPAGSYVLLVTASASGQSASSTFTLVVN